ncbi:hypothetical protein RRF57_012501 [Xylaria bambusicola]|uniref:Integral membrane protein n=1 Tax=Xylaria bambusicola TaxID=326684 RepID=A0AAN7UY38_9PEZI
MPPPPVYICRLNEDDIVVQQTSPHYRSQSLIISFKRTIRVPDNAEVAQLPPGLGDFRLFKTRDFASKLPADITTQAGVFFTLYQSEAMWVDFKADHPFAIKIYAGGVNAVSGEHSLETKETKMRRLDLIAEGKNIQDYVVVPTQMWIDGFAVAPGGVRQFVAMPLGTGYSVEAQLTGQETNSVIHMVLRLRGGGWYGPMGVAAGGKIKQVIRKDGENPEIWVPASTIMISVHILTTMMFRHVTGQKPPKCPISASTYVDAGLPFFHLPEEPSGISGAFDGIKSVNEINVDHGLASGDEPDVKPQVVTIQPREDVATNSWVDMETVQDPDGLVNPNGPLRAFRTLKILDDELEENNGEAE